jgi:hypothetical protein
VGYAALLAAPAGPRFAVVRELLPILGVHPPPFHALTSCDTSLSVDADC